MHTLPRRAFLAALAFAPLRALAIGPLSQLRLARLDYAGDPTTRTSALPSLSRELRLRTSIDVSVDRHVVHLGDPSLFQYPLLVMRGDRDYGGLPAAQASRLKAWIEAGGFLLVDNVGAAGPSEDFDQAIRAELRHLFPRAPLVRLPAEHVLYRDFYRLSHIAGRTTARQFLEGLSIEGRLAVVYSQLDLTGAWARDELGAWEYDVVPGGDSQRELAFRVGINIVQYALCLDYKDDQVHLDYLLHKRKWKITKPQVEP
ncbi:MAG: hypothetical protein AMXMBFR64_41350 [Myxococcales bacterium]